MFCFIGSLRMWRIYWILIFAVVLQAKEGHRQTRQTKPCKNDVLLPELSKSRMCRCLHRPDYQDPSTTVFTPIPPNIYELEKVDIDYPNFGPTLFPKHKNAICVYFGHAGSVVPPAHATTEFVIQAINEHGWPTGKWEMNEFKTSCIAPTHILRSRIKNESLFAYKGCHLAKATGEHVWAHEEGWFSEGAASSGIPDLLHYHYGFTGAFGLTAFVFIEVNDVIRRPKQLKFIAEAPYVDTALTTPPVQLFRIESITYDVDYSVPDIITLTPSSTNIELNLDYAYQVRTSKMPGPDDACLEPPPPPPAFPIFDENSCACFVKPRRPMTFPLQTGIANHSRLDLASQIEEYENNVKVPKEIKDFFNLYKHTEIISPGGPGMERLLVIFYTFLPVYHDRMFREREFIISDFRYDNGEPAGRFLDPFLVGDDVLYTRACDQAATLSATPNLEWSKPPFPAVGKCLPPDSLMTEPKDNQPCYFHFHSDYFFVECTQTCDKPKYVCAVWTFKGTTPPAPDIPFEFQFISNAVYYENKNASKEDYELPDLSKCASTSTVPGVKAWNLLETNAFNKAYYKRSDVWLYNPLAPDKFKFVDISNNHSMTIVSDLYLNKSKSQYQYCVDPATYFLEIKDNNLCLCTFWGENIETWQTHYGRSSSCFHGATTLQFKDHFKIGFYRKRQPDNVRVRVYADLTPPHENLLNDKFVLHAIYLQAIDQFGIPVGKFTEGHWVDSSVSNDLDCPNNQFPPSQNPVNLRFPIFNVKSCPSRNKAIFEKKIEDYIGSGVKLGEIPNVFIYQNRWKDNYPIVCASYSFKIKHYPHVERIQFIAFLRIEDLNAEGDAYMVEIRSDTLDAKDLSLGIPQPFYRGTHEDKHVALSYPPLNYVYFNTTIVPTTTHWDRECIDPIRDPDRLFDTCRHYITTPYTKDSNRPDLDGEIDNYNHICRQWIIAHQNFGPSHPYTIRLDKKLNDVKTPRDEAILDKQCFSLNAYKTRRKNAFHVRFRVDGTSSNCDNFRTPYLKEAALVAYNENGYPIGRPGGSVEQGGSFELYNHFETQDKNKWEHCIDDDIQLTLDDLIDNDKMAFHSEKAKCLYLDTPLVEAYKPDDKLFHQDFGIPGDDYIPSMMIWGNFKRLHNGFCAIWFFPKIKQAGVTPPKYVQFVLEVQIAHQGVKPTAPDPKDDRVITIRSPKYMLNYVDVHAGGTLKNPDLIGDATHPNNEIRGASDKCHDNEADPEVTKMPVDDCVCELRNKGTIVPPGQIQKPLCILKYAFYNHIFDNKLYRTCLTKENARFGADNFPDDDCRTKLEYPRPPEIFPNEQIVLEEVDEGEFNNTVLLEPFDPTDEAYYGCGLIKKCISPFADDKVEKDCIEERSCSMIVTFGKGLGEAHHPTDEVTIEIFAVARGWAAVGISPNDERMGDDYVIECTKEGGEVNVYNSWNVKQTKLPYHTNYRMRGEQGLRNLAKSNIRPVKAVFYQDKLYCKVYIKKRFSKIDPDKGEKHDYNLDQLYYYIMAFSHAILDPYGEEEGNVRTHILNGGASEIGKEKVAGGERLSPLPHEARKFRLHALFMILAWMFFITLSIFVARYFKETLVNTKIFKMDFWYFTHVVTGILALICLAIGTAFQLSAASGWRSLFRSNFHTYSGIVALCFFGSEIIIGCVLKRKIQLKRPLINWVHVFIGHFAYNLALLNMAFADRVAYGFLSCNFKTYCFVWMAVYYVLHAFMSYHYCWVNYIFGRSGSGRKYGAFDVVTQAPHILTDVPGADKSRFSLRKSRKLADLEAQRQSKSNLEAHKIVEAPGKYIRMFALVMFTVITCVYTFWAIRKIIHYPLFCYDFYQLKHLEEHGFN